MKTFLVAFFACAMIASCNNAEKKETVPEVDSSLVNEMESSTNTPKVDTLKRDTGVVKKTKQTKKAPARKSKKKQTSKKRV